MQWSQCTISDFGRQPPWNKGADLSPRPVLVIASAVLREQPAAAGSASGIAAAASLVVPGR
jgi:hypothetical protein